MACAEEAERRVTYDRQQAEDAEASKRSELVGWLCGLGLGELESKFVNKDYCDLAVLMSMGLDDDDMDFMGIADPDHRRRLIQATSTGQDPDDLTAAAPAPAARSAPAPAAPAPAVPPARSAPAPAVPTPPAPRYPQPVARAPDAQPVAIPAASHQLVPSAVPPGVSIAGMSVALAGDVRAPTELWDVMHKAVSHITLEPPQRWLTAIRGVPDEKLVGGFIAKLEAWPDHFPKAAGQVDIHQQVMMSVSLEALASAGWSKERDQGLGVFTAADSTDFVVTTPTYIIARLVAQTLKANGPHNNVQAACSSGYLIAQHAAEHIIQQQCGTVLCTGASLLLKPKPTFCQLVERSVRGVMRPLDQAADGAVLGEGAAAVVFERAEAGEQVHRGVLGWGTSTTSAMLAPGTADQACMCQAAETAIQMSQLPVESIGVTHLHATGNTMSDAAEVDAVSQALAGARTAPNQLVLTGHKANFGHSTTASGLVAITVTALVLEYRFVPRHLGVKNPIKNVTDAAGLLLPVKMPVELEKRDILAASINGTSASGENVHLVLRHDTRMNKGGDPNRRLKLAVDAPIGPKCSFCATPDAMKKCSRCKAVYYCSKDCQLMHWKHGHKSECGAMGRAMAGVFG